MSRRGLPDTADAGPLQVRYAPIEVLVPYVNNARTHSDAQVAQIAASIKEFGFNNPVLVDGERGIIAGHGRVLAARKLGLDKVPVIELAHLTSAQRKAYLIADNKLALNADWDSELLSIELHSLLDEQFDIKLLGFDDAEFKSIFSDDPDASADDALGDRATDVQKHILVVEFNNETDLAVAFDHAKEMGWECKIMS